jgi:hypothetical protein
MSNTVSSIESISDWTVMMDVYSWADATVATIGIEPDQHWRAFWAVWVR